MATYGVHHEPVQCKEPVHQQGNAVLAQKLRELEMSMVREDKDSVLSGDASVVGGKGVTILGCCRDGLAHHVRAATLAAPKVPVELQPCQWVLLR